MHNLISQADLDKIYNKELRHLGKQGVENIIKKTRLDKSLGRKKIFLSHSHLDKTIVQKIVLLFEKINIDLYIDWQDSDLPQKTNKKTATLIKHKIQNCDLFLFLATYYGLRSKWCNWELGIAYSIKQEENLAILPIESKSGNWSGTEYLGLYPEMQINTSNLDKIDLEDINIKTPKKTITLRNWIS